MTQALRISLTVNGKSVTAEVSPRTHLADFLREHLLLTGTHLGCEHGICGACTVEINGDIARSCLTYAVACDGAHVRTIEGFDEDDALMERLRTAFRTHHALQCGYCTPGMLIAARDLIRRKRGLSRADIRREMSGNLCRCTGYIGIVSAIDSVQADPDIPLRHPTTQAWLGPAPGPDTPAPRLERSAASITARPTRTPRLARDIRRTSPARHIPVTVGAIEERDGATRLTQSFVLPHPREAVWAVMSDPQAIARCLPGMSLDTEPAPSAATSSPASAAPLPLAGRLEVKIGPVTASFAGQGTFQRRDAEHRVLIDGRGGDRKSGSRVSGGIDYRLTPAPGTADGEATRVEATMSYTLAGPLAQLGRSNLARDLVRRIGEAFAQNLDAQLTDPTAALPAAGIGGFSLLLRALADRVLALFRGDRR